MLLARLLQAGFWLKMFFRDLRRQWFALGYWWGDAFAAWLIGRLGVIPADRVESFLSWNDKLRIKEALDARID